MADSTTDKLPEHFDSSDGWSDKAAGLEQCPVCERVYSPNGGYTGPVYDETGTRYETHLDTEPGQGPYFCMACWPELEANRKAKENKTLGEYNGS
jgi:hypothetical protein